MIRALKMKLPGLFATNCGKGGSGNLIFGIAGTLFLILSLGFPASSAVSFAPMGYVYPVMAPRLSSNYGIRIHPIRRFSSKHKGIDLAAPIGSPIRAIARGTVVFADPYAGFGNLVVIKHNNRITSHYAHCDRIKVKPGQILKAGAIIAYVGNIGMSTGPHLHFEIRVDGEPRNPEAFIPGLAAQAEG